MEISSNSKALDLIKSNWTQWIAKKIKFEVINEYDIQVLTSFTDYFGDGILFDILENDYDDFSLTDKGYTLWNMEMNGINLSKRGSTRNKLFTWYLKSFGFKLNNNSISKDNIKLKQLSQSMSDFIQLLLRISDLGATNRANTRGIFFDDAKNYFKKEKNLYYYTTNNIALGKTQQQYTFEYNFTPSLGTNKLTKLYNTLSKNTMEAIIGIYIDTKDYLRSNYRNSSFNVLVNEINPNTQQYASGLKEHHINVINYQDKGLVADTLGVAA